MRSGFRGIVIGLLACAASVAVSGSAHADGNMQLEVGKKQYMKYCATCHGPSGSGTDGAASRLFTKPPTNLTLLAKNNGGKFPMMEVIGIVRGDQPIAAHGTREMPVWGRDYSVKAAEYYVDVPYSQEGYVRARILALCEYINRLQTR